MKVSIFRIYVTKIFFHKLVRGVGEVEQVQKFIKNATSFLILQASLSSPTKAHHDLRFQKYYSSNTTVILKV